MKPYIIHTIKKIHEWKKWSQIYTKSVNLSTSTKINTPLFADDQAIVADSDDNLQTGVFTLQT